MNPTFQILYILAILILSGLALYLTTLSSNLSLPSLTGTSSSSSFSILTALLPILSTLPNFFPVLGSPFSVLAAVILTLQATNLASFPSCVLEAQWQRLYSSHDATRIRRIQDALDCCGFKRPKDRAWPFPKAGGPDASPCGEQFGRTEGCMVPWGKEVKKFNWGQVGVAVGVLVLRGLVAFFVQRYYGRMKQSTNVSMDEERRRSRRRGNANSRGGSFLGWLEGAGSGSGFGGGSGVGRGSRGPTTRGDEEAEERRGLLIAGDEEEEEDIIGDEDHVDGGLGRNGGDRRVNINGGRYHYDSESGGRRLGKDGQDVSGRQHSGQQWRRVETPRGGYGGTVGAEGGNDSRVEVSHHGRSVWDSEPE